MDMGQSDYYSYFEEFSADDLITRLHSLERNAQDISVAEIIAAIQGPIAMTECSVEEGLCAQEAICSLRGNWQRISVAVAKAMEGVSLAEMAQPVKPSAVPLHITTLNT